MGTQLPNIINLWLFVTTLTSALLFAFFFHSRHASGESFSSCKPRACAAIRHSYDIG